MKQDHDSVRERKPTRQEVKDRKVEEGEKHKLKVPMKNREFKM
jgi:hypothetical protein